MVERVVMVKLKEEYANPAGRKEVAAYSRKVLAKVPRVRGVEAGVPADARSEGSWDLYLRVRFGAMDDVAPYLADPDHRAYVDEYLVPRMEIIKAWNFVVGSGA